MNKSHLCTLVALCAGAGWAGGITTQDQVKKQTKERKVVMADEFQVVDEKGKPRIVLNISEDGHPLIRLNGIDGEPGIQIAGPNKGDICSIALLGDKGERGITLAIEHLGCPVMRILDQTGASSLVLATNSDGSPTMAIMHNDSQVVFSIEKENPKLEATKGKDKVWKAP